MWGFGVVVVGALEGGYFLDVTYPRAGLVPGEGGFRLDGNVHAVKEDVLPRVRARGRGARARFVPACSSPSVDLPGSGARRCTRDR